LEKRIAMNFLFLSAQSNSTKIAEVNSTLRVESEDTLLLDSLVFFRFFDDKDSIKSGKNIYRYDLNRYQTYKVQYSWKDDINKLIEDNKQQYQYDDYGNILFFEYFDWNVSANNWVISIKDRYEYEYGEGRTVLSSIYYQWDTDKNAWSFISKLTNSYDNNENPISSFSYKWDDINNIWIEDTKEEFFYDFIGNLTSSIQYSWSILDNDWVKQTKKEQSYDDMNNLTISEIFTWNTDGQRWVTYIRNEYSYNANGKLTLAVNIDSTHICECTAKYELFYDNNALSYEIIYKWDYEYNNWVKEGKNEYESLNNGSITLKKYSIWDAEINNWQKKLERYCYYSPFDSTKVFTINNKVLSVEEGMLIIKLYPNPTKDFIKFDWRHFDNALVFNLNGEILIETNKQTIDLRNLKAGTYIVKLLGNYNSVLTYRVIKGN
jgi:hypothetical protein